MLTLKTIGYTIIGLLSAASYFLLMPLTKQYTGMTGYVYEYGFYFDILRIVLLILSCVCISYAFCDMNYEIPD